jgi:sulfur-oxidizing protein SoxY
LNGQSRIGSLVEAHLFVRHPNTCGMQMDQVTRNYVPADFVHTIEVTYNGAPVVTV